MSTQDCAEPKRHPSLREQDVPAQPLALFTQWYEQAQTLSLREPQAMTLATSTPDGMPSARVVLLKAYDEQGFVFFTNYHSRKGQELTENPNAALLFYWDALVRQVRIEGSISLLDAAESDAYFDSRPRNSRLGALASPQSQVIASREVLDQRFTELAQTLSEQDIRRPSHWGGYRLHPNRIEFWQGLPDRLHDRLRYRQDGQGEWLLERLAP